MCGASLAARGHDQIFTCGWSCVLELDECGYGKADNVSSHCDTHRMCSTSQTVFV